jgi:hypothetical protein
MALGTLDASAQGAVFAAALRILDEGNRFAEKEAEGERDKDHEIKRGF